MAKRILITGAASGIGEATAKLFVEKGWQVGLLDLELERLQALSQSLGSKESPLWFAAVDVVDFNALNKAVGEFANAVGELNLMFNCAGLLQTGHFETIPIERHHAIINVNVQGVLNGCYAAYPFLKRSQGQVINMSSASALYGTPHFASYSASKLAVRGLTEALNIEWAEAGIRVGDMMPPFVNTPMVSGQAFVSPIVERLGVDLSAEDIAQAVWAAVDSDKVHHPVGWKFKTMKQLDQFLPDGVKKSMLAFLSKE